MPARQDTIQRALGSAGQNLKKGGYVAREGDEAEAIVLEWMRCTESVNYFTNNYVKIFDSGSSEWIDFDLWPEQERALDLIVSNQLSIILKARQLGLTWLTLSYGLWRMLFYPVAEVLLFSRRDTEAIYMLDERLKGMYKRLPMWMKADKLLVDNNHVFMLSNNSTARAFPTSAGDSYTANVAIVDEADLVPDLNKLLSAVKPTIDTGGQMVLLSRADKDNPNSEFKALYRAAKSGNSPWKCFFIPWHARPERTAAWYEAQVQDSLVREGSLDAVHEQYPATDTEALSARTVDKRIPSALLEKCYVERKPLDVTAFSDLLPQPPVGKRVFDLAGKEDRLHELFGQNISIDEAQEVINAEADDVIGLTMLDGLKIFEWPEPDKQYVIGCDPAEGNPTSDDSVSSVLDVHSGVEVAVLGARYQVNVFSMYTDLLSGFYNRAPILVERNNHGHAVILWLDLFSTSHILKGRDKRLGWVASTLGKALLYNEFVASLMAEELTIHHFETNMQLSSISGATLRAPVGEPDDYAVAIVLANQARKLAVKAAGISIHRNIVSLWEKRTRESSARFAV